MCFLFLCNAFLSYKSCLQWLHNPDLILYVSNFDRYFTLVLLLHILSFVSFLGNCKIFFLILLYYFLPFFDNIGDFMKNDFGLMLLAIHLSRNINWFFVIANFTFSHCSCCVSEYMLLQ